MSNQASDNGAGTVRLQTDSGGSDGAGQEADIIGTGIRHAAEFSYSWKPKEMGATSSQADPQDLEIARLKAKFAEVARLNGNRRRDQILSPQPCSALRARTKTALLQKAVPGAPSVRASARIYANLFQYQQIDAIINCAHFQAPLGT
jgi:hypothetical protein